MVRVPYLLDSRARDLVKLFPPIIVVVLPVEDIGNRPANFYPKVEILEEEAEGQDYTYKITRSGEVGREVFQFEQPVQGGRAFEHDLTRLKLNTNDANSSSSMVSIEQWLC